MPPLPPTFSLILTMGSTTLMHTIANSLVAIYVISSTLLILPTCVTTRSEAPYIIWSISSKFYFKARHHQFGQCSTIFTPCSKCKSKEFPAVPHPLGSWGIMGKKICWGPSCHKLCMMCTIVFKWSCSMWFPRSMRDIIQAKSLPEASKAIAKDARLWGLYSACTLA